MILRCPHKNTHSFYDICSLSHVLILYGFVSESVLFEHVISMILMNKRYNQDGRVVKALDLSSNGRMSAWVRSPLLVTFLSNTHLNLFCYFVSKHKFFFAIVIFVFFGVEVEYEK